MVHSVEKVSHLQRSSSQKLFFTSQSITTTTKSISRSSIQRSHKNSLSSRFFYACLHLIAFISAVSLAQPCPSTMKPFPSSYLFENLKETTQQIQSYHYLELSTTSTTTSSSGSTTTSVSSSDQFLYILKRGGNLSILNAKTSTFLNAFDIDKISASLVAWDFNASNTIIAHVLDISGNVYEIDGNYGRQNSRFDNPLAANPVPLSSNPCISLLHETYISWDTTRIYFVRYGTGVASSERKVQFDIPSQNMTISSCTVTSDKNRVVFHTDTTIAVISSMIATPSLTIEFQETNILSTNSTLYFSSLIQNYSILYYNKTSIISLTVHKNGVATPIYQFNQATRTILAASIDVVSNLLVYTSTTGEAFAIDLATLQILHTFSFLELPISFDESSASTTTNFSDPDSSLAYIQSLAISTIDFYTDPVTTNRCVCFQGSMILFTYNLNVVTTPSSAFTPIRFKSIGLVSTSLVGIFATSDFLIAVGNIQVSFLKLSDSSLDLIHANYIGTPLTTSNNNFKQAAIDTYQDRLVLLSVSHQLTYYQLSTLTYEKFVMVFRNENTFFELDLIHDKLILFSKRDTTNLSVGSQVFEVYIYTYSTGSHLFTFTNSNRFIYDTAADSSRGEYFFSIYQAEILHYKFDSQTSPTLLVSYTIPAWTSGLSIQLITSPSSPKLIVSIPLQILIFNYYTATPALTYSLLTTPSYLATFSSFIVASASGSTISTYSIDTNSVIQWTSSSTSLVIASAFDSNQDLYFSATYSNSNLTLSSYTYSTGSKITQVTVSSTQTALKLFIDQNIYKIVIVGSIGTIFTVSYTPTTLTLESSYVVSTVATSKAYFDSDVGFVHVFFTDYSYAVYKYSIGSLLRFMKLTQLAVSFAVSTNKQTSTIILTNQVLRMSYKQSEVVRQFMTSTNASNRFYEDPQRGIIVASAQNFIYIISFWENNKIINILNLEPTIPSIVFGDIKVSQSQDMIAIASTISGQETNYLYVLKYSTFELIQRLDHPTSCTSVRGSEFDEGLKRLFVYCRLGTFYIWSFPSSTNPNFTTTLVKAGYLGSSSITSIGIWPEQNIILFTSNSWWSKTLKYDTLAEVNVAIPGVLGYFAKDYSLHIQYDQNGMIWVYQFETSADLFSDSVHTNRVNFVIITKEASYSTPSIISGRYLILTREYTLSNRKYYVHDSEFAVGYLDEKSSMMICGDKKGQLLLLTFPELILSRLIKVHSTAIIQLEFKLLTNLIVTSSNNGQIVIWDYSTIIQLQPVKVLTGKYGINEVAEKGDLVYLSDSFGLVQEWNLSKNSMRFAFFQKREQSAYVSSSIRNIANTSSIIALYPTQFITMDTTTFQKQSISVSCRSFEYFATPYDLAFCLSFNTFSAYRGSTLTLISSVTITTPDSSAITSISFIAEFDHFIFQSATGTLSIFTYDNTLPTPSTRFSLVASISNAQIPIQMFLADATNTLLIIAYSTGPAYTYTYTKTLISSLTKTPFTSIPYSNESSPIVNLKVIEGNKLLVRRLYDNIVSILEYPSLVISRNSTSLIADSYLDPTNPQRPNLLRSPCVGADSTMEWSAEFSTLVIACVGQYNLYSSTTFSMIGYLREISKISSLQNTFQLRSDASFKFISRTFFIDSVLSYLLIIKVDSTTTTPSAYHQTSLAGEYESLISVHRISSSNLVYSEINPAEVYAVQILQYSMISPERVMIPLISQMSFCQLETTASLFLLSLRSLETIYSQSQAFSTVNKFELIISVTHGINMPFFPDFKYSSISSIVVEPLTSSSSTLIHATTSSFTSASAYLELHLRSLSITFDKATLTSTECALKSPLKLVEFDTIDITTNTNDLTISFTNIPTVTLTHIHVTFEIFIVDANNRLLAASTTTSYLNPLFQVQYVLSLTVTDFTVENQLINDIILIEVQNEIDSDLLTPAYEVASAKFSSIFIRNNRLLSSIVETSTSMSIISPLISLTFIPVVEMTNIIADSNSSNNKHPSGLIETQACSSFSISDSTFTKNSNVFFLYNNATYTQLAATSASTKKRISKFYYLAETIATYTDIVVSKNTLHPIILAFIRINIDAITQTRMSFIENIHQASLTTPDQDILASSASLISFQDTTSLAISSIEFTSNIAHILTLASFSSILEITISGLTANSNTSNKGIIHTQNCETINFSSSSFSKNHGRLGSAGITSITAKLTLTSLTFNEDSTQTSGTALDLSSSTATITASQFTATSASQNGAALTALNSVINLDHSSFQNCAAGGSGGAIAVTSTTLYIDTVSFSDSSATLVGGAIYAQSDSLITSTKSVYANNQADEGGAIYLSECSIYSYITTSNFQSNLARGSGGSVLLNYCAIDISQSKFEFNTAGIGGAIRYFGLLPAFLSSVTSLDLNSMRDAQGYLVIQSNSFKDNTGVMMGADIGSVLSQVSVSVDASEDFQFNQIKADSIYAKPVDSDTDYQFNFTNMRSGAKNFPFRIQLADILGQSLKHSLTDVQDQIAFTLSSQLVSEIKAIRCKVVEQQSSTVLEEQDMNIDGSVIVDYVEDKDAKFFGFSLNSIQVIGIPGKTGSFCLSFDGLLRLESSSQKFVASECIDILVSFRKCVIGETYSPRCASCTMNSCTICKDGTYSLVEPEVNGNISCQTCNTQVASVCYANHIELLQGYWRESNSTDVIIYCDNKYKACTGTEETKYCAKGYIGPLCETCDLYGNQWGERYAVSSSYSVSACLACADISSEQVYQIIILISIGAYIFFQMINSNQSSVDYIKGTIIKQIGIAMVQTSLVNMEFTVLSKLLIHYISVQEITTFFPVKEELFKDDSVYSVPKQFLFPIGNLFHGFDCYLSDPKSLFADTPIEYARLLLTFMQCFALLVIIVLLYVLLVIVLLRFLKYRLVFIKSHYLSFSAFISSLLFFLYYMQQTITSSSIQILSCKLVGDKQYLASQLNKQCYTDEYFQWFPLVFGTFMLSAFVYPITIFIILNRNKANFNKSFRYKMIRRYSFLYQEFKNSCWWWEVLKIVLRQIIIIITQISIFELIEKACLIILILLLYLVLAMRMKPYKNKKLNAIDNQLNCISIVLIIFSIYNTGITNTVQQNVNRMIMLLLKTLSLGSVGMKLADSFLQQQMHIISDSPKVLFIFSLFSKCCSERLFCRRNSFLRTRFPSFYLLIHRPQVISIDRHYRWLLLQKATLDYIKRRRTNINATFVKPRVESVDELRESLQVKLNEKKRCWSKILLKSYSKTHISAESPKNLNSPKISRIKAFQHAKSTLPANGFLTSITVNSSGNLPPVQSQPSKKTHSLSVAAVPKSINLVFSKYFQQSAIPLAEQSPENENSDLQPQANRLESTQSNELDSGQNTAKAKGNGEEDKLVYRGADNWSSNQIWIANLGNQTQGTSNEIRAERSPNSPDASTISIPSQPPNALAIERDDQDLSHINKLKQEIKQVRRVV